MDKTFSERLRQLRQEKNVTQRQVCDWLGFSRNAYGNYELGIREPSLDALCKLCDFFDVSADYLLGRTNID